VVLFIDEEETEFFRFSFEEANQMVMDSRIAYDVPAPPRVNESCNWCANFFQCPRQLELAASALTVTGEALPWPEILAQPDRLSKFLLGVSALKEFEKTAREQARQFLFQKVAVPGFHLSNGKRSWSLPLDTLFLLLSSGDEAQMREAMRAALEVHGAMTREQYLELCRKLGLEPDTGLLKESKGEPFIIRNKEKGS
jgi:hypothetical protein